jgi:DNA invertase Pin-like site-specific DNA recombinase
MGTKKVIKISPMNKHKQMRIAVYARVSTAKEKQQHSLQSQLNYYHSHVNQIPNAVLVEVYHDFGITGTVVNKRYGFSRMLIDCELGKIDRIITKSITRFARNHLETLRTVRKLKGLGVSILFEEERIDTAKMTSELELTMYAQVAEAESKTISQNLQWAFKSRAKEGIYNQQFMPYGYSRIEGRVVINENEAKVVDLLFTMFVNKKQTTNKIEKYFNENKIGNRTWTRCGINKMLRNERYCGDMLLQKTYSLDVFPYQRALNKGERQQYYVYDSFPAIISKEIFDNAQILLKRMKEDLTENQLQGNKIYDYTSKIKCSHCGTTFRRRISEGKESWVCQKHFDNKDICGIKKIFRNELDEIFLKVYYRLKNNDFILQAYCNQVKQKMLNTIKQNKVEKELLELSKTKSQVLHAYVGNKITVENYLMQLRKLNYHISEKELEKKKAIEKIDSHPVIYATKSIIHIVESSNRISEFQKEIFDVMIKRIEIGDLQVQVILQNDLHITFDRKQYYGNYS